MPLPPPLFIPELKDAPLDETSTGQVLNSLSDRQNKDGGFGSFTAGSRKTRSTPLQTHAATEIILQSGVLNRQHTRAVHPVIIGIIHYLKNYSPLQIDNKKTSDNTSPTNTMPSCWKTGVTLKPADYHPLAALTGFSLAFSPRHLPLYKHSLTMAGRLVREFLKKDDLEDANAISSMKRLIEHINNNHITLPDPAERFNLKIRQQLKRLALRHH